MQQPREGINLVQRFWARYAVLLISAAIAMTIVVALTLWCPPVHRGAESVWAEVTTAKWFANVGIPTVVAGAAVVAAWLFVQRQLAENRREVRAALNREHANRYTTSARASLADLHEVIRDFYVARSIDYQTYVDRAVAIANDLIRTTADLQVQIGMTDYVLAAGTVVERLKVRLQGSERFQFYVDLGWAEGVSTGVPARQALVDHTAILAVNQLRQVIVDIEKWDGLPDGSRSYRIPDALNPLPMFSHAPTDGSDVDTAIAKWQDHEREVIDEEAEKHRWSQP
ncbi:hypothetical protein FK531_10710 [Rhodococcus spelaei]|uniref:Uncharacterized protein n=1 Tax=Rhodococcus spelaei TaxID=2546320 RepID=A0A541BA51_9NOCA|nr:hypothetical protein [Rhodococcus spelaei]TQF69214.1 hypothetical protein FK531_10710 [Rhodococcus spelaei]